MVPLPSRQYAKIRIYSKAASIITVLVGVLVLVGWIYDIPVLKSVDPSRIPMMANSAVAFILCGAALWVFLATSPTRGARLGARIAAILVLVLSGLTLFEYLLDHDLGIDQLLFEVSTDLPGYLYPGRMAINSAITFLLIAAGLLLLDVKTRGGHSPAQFIAVFVFCFGLMALYDYAYGDTRSLFGFKSYTESAIHSVITFLVLSSGILAARPDQGLMAIVTAEGPGSTLARRLLPVAILLPLVLSWFGWGEPSTAVFGNQFLTALLAVSSIVIFSFVLWWNAWAVNRSDAEVKQMGENLRMLAAHLQSVREEERTHIAREIHDQLGQELTVLKIGLAWLAKKLAATSQEPLTEKSKTLLEVVDSTIQSVQKISTELRPGVLDNLGIAAAIEWQAHEFQRRTGIACETMIAADRVSLDPARSTAVFRIFQEILTNVARHSGADEVHLILTSDGATLFLEVQDNGRGISAEEMARSRSLGILGMRERALMLGGQIEIIGSPGRGTTVTLQLPLQSSTASQGMR